jgi:hypothetical protein
LVKPCQCSTRIERHHHRPWRMLSP